MILRRLITFVSVIAAIACLVSCSWTSYEVTELEVPGQVSQSGVVTLDLSVSVLEAIDPQAGSRTYADTEDGTFEQAANAYEKLSTLRVVIVRENGIIEHNRMVNYNVATGLINHDNLQFEVISGEEKQIYLFGNEKAVSLDNDEFSFGASLQVGEKFPYDAIEDLLLKTKGNELAVNNNSAVIDNYSSGSQRCYVPMSEFFKVQVDKPHPGSTAYQNEHLFITRSLIKFSFCVTVETPFPGDIKLSGVKLSGLADRSYYLPRKTVYKPEKYTESTNLYEGRYIESFETLIDDKNEISYEFPVLEPFDMSHPGSRNIEQHVYFPETKGKYGVELLFESDDMQYMTDLLGTQLLELTEIPRNTHVKVNITFRTHEITATVDLVPYIGVDLNPDFGLGDIIIKPPKPRE